MIDMKKGFKMLVPPWNKGKKGEYKLDKNSGKNHWNWNGGTHVRQDGYLMFSAMDGSRNKYVHRVIAERVLDRALLDREVVHHIDNDKQNNKIENLYLFRHQSAHQRWHRFLRRHGLDGELLESNLATV